MKPGDLIEFKCIGAGRHDKPKYSHDGSWRLGLLIDCKGSESTILYMGDLFTILSEQTRCIGVYYEDV